jgi:hypothetical protein
VISAYLYNTRGALAPNGVAKTEQDDVTMHNVYQAGGNGSDAQMSPAANLTPFVRTVYDAIVANRGPAEGVHVAAIARTLQSQSGRKAMPSEVS